MRTKRRFSERVNLARSLIIAGPGNLAGLFHALPPAGRFRSDSPPIPRAPAATPARTPGPDTDRAVRLLSLLMQNTRVAANRRCVSFPDTQPKEAIPQAWLPFQVTCRNVDYQALMKVRPGRILRQLSGSILAALPS